jgi:hypothetical protein
MKRRPAIGTKVMRTYGRREYVDFGEIGVVTGHGDGNSFSMTLDADQPFARWMWGSKAKRTDHGGQVHAHLGPSEVEPLAAVYYENARRFRAVAKVWAEHARAVRTEQGGEGR